MPKPTAVFIAVALLFAFAGTAVAAGMGGGGMGGGSMGGGAMTGGGTMAGMGMGMGAPGSGSIVNGRGDGVNSNSDQDDPAGTGNISISGRHVVKLSAARQSLPRIDRGLVGAVVPVPEMPPEK